VLAAEAVDASGIDLSAALAWVRLAKRDAEPQAHRYANGLVVKLESACRDWDSMKPIATMRSRYSCKSGVVEMVIR
jgi:hypothetical protein